MKTFKKILQATPAAIEFRQELAEQYLMARKYKEAKEQLEGQKRKTIVTRQISLAYNDVKSTKLYF